MIYISIKFKRFAFMNANCAQQTPKPNGQGGPVPPPPPPVSGSSHCLIFYPHVSSITTCIDGGDGGHGPNNYKDIKS